MTSDDMDRADNHDAVGDGVVDNPVILLNTVQNALSMRASTEVFAIGGAIALEKPSEPVTIRWESNHGSKGLKASLPLGEDEASRQAFQQLLDDCQPATFGRGQEEVLDTDYRKAGKMDVAAFCTDFNLAEHQIMNTLTQALVQGKLLADGQYPLSGVIAKLYSLNIYSAPSGKFKAHVDTPRSESQMGSLVVCLPHPHQAVRHGGKETVFDWSSKSSNNIQWAAFFSDCEHEVLEVTQGHRITLTYNLFWSKGGPSTMATQPDALDPNSLHFFTALERLYRSPLFLPHGGRIGFTCTHAYPHTSDVAILTLDHNLKGLDMVVYQALKRLNGDVSIRAVLNPDHWDEETLRRVYEEDDDFNESDNKGSSGKEYQLSEMNFLSKNMPPFIHGDEIEEGQSCPDSISYWKASSHANRAHKQVPYFPRTEVTWLNGSPHSFEELAAMYIECGNQPSLEAFYSAAVLISKVPPFEKRKCNWMDNMQE